MGESAGSLTFLTPYWSGAEMMRIHLASIRRFHAADPILVSKRGGGEAEMESYRQEFGVQYWLEDCSYMDSYLRLLERCETRYVCIMDHDAVLLASLEPYVRAIAAGRYEVLGIEECIRLPPSVDAASWPGTEGWLRYAPGCIASNFILFDWQAFRARWGLKGILGQRIPGALHYDFDYGIGQRLSRHHYLRPYHARRYGIGNLLKDGEHAVAWHQWYGSYRTRLPQEMAEDPADDLARVSAAAEAGERAFLADYPNLDFEGLSPAWLGEAPSAGAVTALRERSSLFNAALRRLRRWQGYGISGLARRCGARVERWWRLR